MQGWNLLKKEFEAVFREITQLGYAVYFISHAKEGSFKRQDGSEYTLIRPSVANTYNSIVENMADLYGYMHPVVDDSGTSIVKITLRSADGTISAGGRFKCIAPEINGNYNALVKALNEAIDKEAAQTGNKYVTDEKMTVTGPTTYDFDALMKEFNEITQRISSENPDTFNESWAPKITQIIERYLGKGHKVNQATRDQAEMIYMIVSDLKEL